MSVNWSKFAEIVSAHQRFVLTSHIRPDCDALGSELGMAGVLEALGKDVLIVNAQATPPGFHFLDPEGSIKTLGEDISIEQLESREVLIVLDTSAWAQLGDMGEVVRTTMARKLIVDHHVSEDDLGAESFKDTTAEATGRLVVEAAEHLGVTITPAMAAALFAAIATDTGWFRFGSTSPTTMRAGAKLIEAGARPAAIYQSLYERETLARLQLVGRTLARAKSELSGRLVHTSIHREDFNATCAIPSDTEDVINMTLAVEGTEVAVILVEQPGGGFKLSFRSRSAVDCSKLAEQFGGGGHKAAAGAFIAEPFEAAQQKVLDAVRTSMR